MEDGHFKSKNTSCFKSKKDVAALEKTPKTWDKTF